MRVENVHWLAEKDRVSKGIQVAASCCTDRDEPGGNKQEQPERKSSTYLSHVPRESSAEEQKAGMVFMPVFFRFYRGSGKDLRQRWPAKVLTMCLWKSAIRPTPKRSPGRS
ncbi:hypothetical protein FF011L_34680 [Roseimaritima multifibrata]|uniref:Uncharacterized protein n=1 Tax=Roseimaritima multifibrata TaxID=1930274 RepID=A0A517MIL3_9BACT|nr:hypothetical protein FF011L_34680 [Roseimaritima multifibrata]